MQHSDWVKFEANTITLSKCCCCGIHGYALVVTGWDMITDEETGEDLDICPECSEE